MTDDSNVRRLRPPIPWEKLVRDHKGRHTESDEEIAAFWERLRADQPWVDYVVPGRPLHETMPMVIGHLLRSKKPHNEAFRLAPMQRLWQIGRRIARRLGARWAR